MCSPSSSSSPHNRQLLLDPCLLVARYTPKHPRPLSPCVRRYSIELCSRRTPSLILEMSLCVHLPYFDESHSSCHLLKRVSLAFPHMMFLSSSGKGPCLCRYSFYSTHISFLSRASNLIGRTPKSTYAAHLDNVHQPQIMRQFILRCTAPIRLSTKYAGMKFAQVGAPYS